MACEPFSSEIAQYLFDVCDFCVPLLGPSGDDDGADDDGGGIRGDGAGSREQREGK